MLNKYITLMVVTAGLALNTQAQEWDWATSVSYSFGLPTGDLKDYTDNTSFRGIIIDTRNFQNSNVTIGFSFGWQVFKDRADGTFSVDGNDITGTQVRYVNTIPIMITGHYYLADEGGVRPYVGAGVGTVHSIQRTEIGLFAVKNNNWHFGFYPEVGVMIPVSFDMAINLGAKYNYAIATSDSFDYTYLALSLGLTWLR